jgi:sugar phosphate isomerase/epimerase
MRFGCQARSFGEGIYKDEATFLDVVRQVGEVGFEGLETNWKNLERYFGRPADFAKVLKDARLTLIGAHMGGNPWGPPPRENTLADVGRTAQFVKSVGGTCIVFSGSLPKGRPNSAESWRQMADFANEIGGACADKDICAGGASASGGGCLYHNHWWECEASGLEIVHELTDPKLVAFAFDTGHAVRAGKDPAAMIRMLSRRLGMIHLADFDERLPSPGKRPTLGEGRLNMSSVVEALRAVAFDKWIVLEEETQVGAARPQVEKAFAVLQSVLPRTK